MAIRRRKPHSLGGRDSDRRNGQAYDAARRGWHATATPSNATGKRTTQRDAARPRHRNPNRRHGQARDALVYADGRSWDPRQSKRAGLLVQASPNCVMRGLVA
jgi:hypothetical protein